MYGYAHEQLIGMSIGEISDNETGYSQSRAMEWLDQSVAQGAQRFNGAHNVVMEVVFGSR